jgi:hypothetical protein
MAKYELLEFTTNTRFYSQAGAIEKSNDDLGYHFVNTGSVICYINSLPLYPSGVLDTMYAGYKDRSLYNIKFDTAAGTNPELLVLTYQQK